MTFPEPGGFLEKSASTRPYMANGRESSRPPPQLHWSGKLRLDDSDDLMRTRIDDHDLIANEDVVVAAPFRINRNDFDRQRIHVNAGRNTRSHAHRYVKVSRFDLMFPNDGRNLRTLLGRQLG